MTLTASQLFTPLPSGVFDGVTPLTVPANTWLSNILANAGNLPVTSWQSGGTAWTELLVFAAGLSQSDANVSLIAQGALLDFAATGTVTYVNAQGNVVTVPVTPDPSIPAQNPTGALGWLDALADSVYSTTRLVAGFANGPLYYANTTGSSLGTYAAGTFHVANTATGATYSNQVAFTFAASSAKGTSIVGLSNVTAGVFVATSTPHTLANGTVVYLSGCGNLTFGVVQVITASGFNLLGATWNGVGGTSGKVWSTSSVNCVADAIGPSSSAVAGAVTLTTTSVPGGAVSNATAAWSGAAWESNVGLAARCRYKLQSLSVNGPKGAYAFAALTSSLLLATQSPPAALYKHDHLPRRRVAGAFGTGRCRHDGRERQRRGARYLESACQRSHEREPDRPDGPEHGGDHERHDGEVLGHRGQLRRERTLCRDRDRDGTDLALNGSTGNGAYISGGNVEAGDLGLVDSVIQQAAVPNATTAATLSAAPLPVNVSAVVYVPSAFLADYGTNPLTNKGATALANYLPSLPIGGVLGVDGQTSGVVPVSAVSELLFDAGQSGGKVYTVSVGSLTLNGNPADVRVGATSVSVLGTVNVQVVGV